MERSLRNRQSPVFPQFPDARGPNEEFPATSAEHWLLGTGISQSRHKAVNPAPTPREPYSNSLGFSGCCSFSGSFGLGGLVPRSVWMCEATA